MTVLPASPTIGDNSALERWRTEKLIKSRVKSIKARGGTAEEQFAALADRVKDEVFDIEYELQALFKKQHFNPKSPVVAEDREEVEDPHKAKKGGAGGLNLKGEYRKCLCGCGELLFNIDETPEQPWEPGSRKLLEEMDKRDRANKAEAAAQRAHCEKMSRRKEAAVSEDQDTPTAGSEVNATGDKLPKVRPPDYSRLKRLAKPREVPEAPEEHSFQPQLVAKKGHLRKERSEPVLSPTAASAADEDPATPSRVTSLPPVPFGPDVMQMMQSPLVMLRYNAKKSSLGGRKAMKAELKSTPALRRSDSGDVLPRLTVRSVASQRQYTEERLYSKPKHAPGSNEELQARLNALREQNQALQEERERRQKGPVH